MRKKMILSIIVILLFINCTYYSAGVEEKEISRIIEEAQGKTYDPYLYGDFLNNTIQSYYIVPFYGDEKAVESGKIIVDKSEKITIPLFIFNKIDYGFEKEQQTPVEDVHIRFILLNKDDWLPEEAHWSYHYDTHGMTELAMGEKYEEDIKFGHRWFNELEEKTDNVYSLDFQPFRYSSIDEENITIGGEEVKFNVTGIETSLSIKIYQAGFWSLSTLMKPVGGKHWVLAEGRNITIKVRKPDDIVNNSLPILLPGITIGVFALCTYSIKKRISWFGK